MIDHQTASSNYNAVKNFTGGMINSQNFVGTKRQIGASPNNFSGMIGPKSQKSRGKSENHAKLLN